MGGGSIKQKGTHTGMIYHSTRYDISMIGMSMGGMQTLESEEAECICIHVPNVENAYLKKH